MKSKSRAFCAKFVTQVALSAALMSVCAMISIPFFVPLTLQTFAFYFILFAFGGAVGLFSSLVYVAMGLVGLPVFAGFGGGVGKLLEPSGGFILGFILAALVYFGCEGLFRGRAGKRAGTVLSLFALYLCGATVLILLYAGDVGSEGAVLVLSYYVVPYIVPDVIKILLAALAAMKIGKHVRF